MGNQARLCKAIMMTFAFCLATVCTSGASGSTCTEKYYYLNVTGNANGTIEFGRSKCNNNLGELWYENFDVAGDGGGWWSGIEVILPFATRLPPLKYLPPAVGDTWSGKGTSDDYPVKSEAIVTSVTEEISVTAGTFSNCAKVLETFSYPKGYTPGQLYPTQFERWFAPGIGPVKLRITDNDANLYLGELVSHENIPNELDDYFPLGSDYTWTFRMDDGRTATWVAGVYGLISPDGGEVVPSGSEYTIEWGAPEGVASFDIRYSMDRGSTWNLIANGWEDTSYRWQVPIPTKNQKNCLVKIIGFDSKDRKVGGDQSDAPFTIEVMEITSPNGGEILRSGTPVNITWRTNETKREVAKVKLYYSTNGGAKWILMDTVSGDPGTYPWTVPPVKHERKKCKVKVILQDSRGKALGSDVSDRCFTMNLTSNLPTIPILVSPPDRTVFDHFPRTTTLQWNASDGEPPITYFAETQYTWCGDFTDFGSWEEGCYAPYVSSGETSETEFTFDFVGSQPGRWRVRAKNEYGMSDWSEWWYFRYTQ